MRLAVLERLASEGVPEMQFLLGFLKENGLGYSEDIDAAHEWYRRAGDRGFAPAQYMMYYANGPEKYQSRTSNEAQSRIADDWLDKAAAAGFGPAQVDLSYRVTDHEKSYELLKAAAEQGYAQAGFLLGNIHREGRSGHPPDPLAAFYWFKRAAESGSAEAAYVVAEALRYGIKAWSEAAIRSTDIGNPKLSPDARKAAGEAVARILTDGESATSSKEKAEAFHWYLRAFDMRSPDAASALSTIYSSGKLGQPKDPTKADYYATKNREFRNWWAESLGFPDSKQTTA